MLEGVQPAKLAPLDHHRFRQIAIAQRAKHRRTLADAGAQRGPGTKPKREK
jgi:hypothetical protein